MEDFYIDNIDKWKIKNARAKCAIKDIATILTSARRHDFDLLCALRELLLNSSHGEYILTNYFDGLKVTRIQDENNFAVVDVLNSLFGFSYKYISTLTRIIAKFIILDVENSTPKYNLEILNDLTISKLQELLPLSMQQIETAFNKKYLTYKSTVKEIREYVKSLKGTEKKENQVLEEPEQTDNKVNIIFNPNIYHEREYFESLSKEELIECILQLQDCYETLLEDED